MALRDHFGNSDNREDKEEVISRYIVHVNCMQMCGVRLDEGTGASGQGKMVSGGALELRTN